MNIFTRMKLSNVSRTLSCALLTFVVSGAHADDIEIYEAIGNAQVAVGDGDFNPNILFVLDNSRSMDTFIATQLSATEAAEVIAENAAAGATAVYDRDVDYGLPGRGTELYLYDENLESLNVAISLEQNVCLFAQNFFGANGQNNPALPIYSDRFTRWTLRLNNPDRFGWTNEVVSTAESNRVLECENDEGVNGLPTGGSSFIDFRNGNNTTLTQPQYRNNQLSFQNGDPYPYGNDFFSAAWNLVSENYNAFILGGQINGLPTGNIDDAQQECTFDGERIIIADTGAVFECFTRLQTMKNALENAINGDPNDPDSDGFNDVNIGLMRFNFNLGPNNNNLPQASGGTIIDAVSNIDENDDNGISNRVDFITKLDELDFEGNTPLAESAYEAYLYFDGSNVNYSELNNGNDLTAAQLATFNLPVSINNNLDLDSVENAALSGLTYDSPIGTNQCQDNFMVLLSDGAPTEDTNADGEILSLLNGTNSCGPDGNCLNEVSRALKENLNVNTFTIGFNIGSEILEAAADAGAPDGTAPGDGFFRADNLTELQSAFTQIISNVVDVENDNFVAPAVSVSAFNRLESGSDIYYAVFAPEIFPRWSGNIKKYNIASNSTIIDQDDNNAIDPNTGFFVDDGGSNRARSFWSITPDGAAVTEGGYAARLGITRNIFANLDTDTDLVTELTLVDPTNTDSSSIDSFYNEIFNLDPTGNIIGVDSNLVGTIRDIDDRDNGDTISDREQNLENIIRFTIGEDIAVDDIVTGGLTPTANNFVGESIHSTPVVLSYGNSENEPRDIVFLATNQGMLHAINGQGGPEDPDGGETNVIGGTERWSYIPDPGLLENLGGYFNNSLNGSSDHIYGLDGPLSVESERDVDNNLVSAQIYMGQRRGGNKYFALDVTNAREENAGPPVEKLWTIQGGTADFPRMGDTWAEPIVTNFRSCDAGTCEIIPALVLAGGYDGRPDRYDDIDADIADLSDDVTGALNGPDANNNTIDPSADEPSTDGTLGNAIYIVRADDGEVLWSSSNDVGSVDTSIPHTIIDEMDHSIPTAPTVLTDIRSDDAIDVIFAIDVSGQVFRYDFRRVTENGVDTEVQTGGRIANLQETNINRYFYNPLDAVLLPTTVGDGGVLTGLNRYALVTGSGYRAHPVQPEGFENRFYVIHDENTDGPLLDINGDPEYDYVLTGVNGTLARNEIQISDVPELDDIDATDPDSPTPLQAATTHRFGFRVPLDAGGASKILNPTLIASSIFVGTSYDPDGVATTPCSATPGQSSAFGVSLVTGTVIEFDLAKSGVSGAPVIVYVLEIVNGIEVLKPIVIIGTETFDGSTFGLENIVVGKAIKKAWWETGRSSVN